MKLALYQADHIIFVLKYYFNMLKPDFSDIQKHGFKIRQFRLLLSKNSLNTKNGDLSTSDIIENRDNVIAYLIEQNEIHYTIFYFALRLMFLFIFATILSLLSRGQMYFMTYILAILSIISFIISRKYRQNFFLGDFGINFSKSIYDAKINELYNF
jgi:hypothetical protein